MTHASGAKKSPVKCQYGKFGKAQGYTIDDFTRREKLENKDNIREWNRFYMLSGSVHGP
jgi:hypothetical protein